VKKLDKKIKHLEMIQGIINRLGNNSFFLKGWTVTLTAAIVALITKASNINCILLSIFPIMIFWILDSYFLRQEKLFRKLYNAVRVQEDTEIDFDMDLRPFELEVEKWYEVMWSITLKIFYGCLIVSVIMVYLIILA
jgi:hypothetical protein